MSIDVENLYDRRADNRWDRVAVGDILERMTWSDPDKLALAATPDAVADPQFARLTYSAADRLTNRIANALLGLGLERAARVAMLCENSVEAYLCKLGIAKAGLVAVPVNTMMAPDMVEHVLRHVDARVAVVDADLWETKGAPFSAAGVQPVAAIRGVMAAPAGVPDFADFVASVSDIEPEVRIHGDDIWEILLTSGTTAMPKAVMISHTYSYMAAHSHALSYTRGLALEASLITCSFLPVIYHIGDHANVLPALMTGGRAVIGRRPQAQAIATAVTREAVTCLWGGSPQFVNDLVREVERTPHYYDFTSLTVLVFGWAAMSPGLADALQRLCNGVQLIGLFGQTEAIACHRFWPARWPETYRRTAPEINYVGIPSPMLASTIVDDEGRSLHGQAGIAGEAVYRSPAVTAGYFRDAAATREAFRGGWFHSGDMCVYDDDGLRIMVDRYKDVVKSGGENVSSIRVESVLVQHPTVSRAAVVGVPDARWGEAVTACVIAEPGQTIDEAALMAFCRERLAGFETPKRVVVMEELPVTVGGKVLKYRLRALLR